MCGFTFTICFYPLLLWALFLCLTLNQALATVRSAANDRPRTTTTKTCLIPLLIFLHIFHPRILSTRSEAIPQILLFFKNKKPLSKSRYHCPVLTSSVIFVPLFLHYSSSRVYAFFFFGCTDHHKDGPRTNPSSLKLAPRSRMTYTDVCWTTIVRWHCRPTCRGTILAYGQTVRSTRFISIRILNFFQCLCNYIYFHSTQKSSCKCATLAITVHFLLTNHFQTHFTCIFLLLMCTLSFHTVHFQTWVIGLEYCIPCFLATIVVTFVARWLSLVSILYCSTVLNYLPCQITHAHSVLVQKQVLIHPFTFTICTVKEVTVLFGCVCYL